MSTLSWKKNIFQKVLFKSDIYYEYSLPKVAPM